MEQGGIAHAQLGATQSSQRHPPHREERPGPACKSSPARPAALSPRSLLRSRSSSPPGTAAASWQGRAPACSCSWVSCQVGADGSLHLDWLLQRCRRGWRGFLPSHWAAQGARRTPWSAEHLQLGLVLPRHPPVLARARRAALSPPRPFVPDAASWDPRVPALMGAQPYQDTQSLWVPHPGRWIPVPSLLPRNWVLWDVGPGWPRAPQPL